MDSITHIALGACIGEAIAGKYLGRKALLLGAIAQSVPDIDFISTLWQTESEHVLSHRGFTHSLLFATLSTILLSLLSRRIFRIIPIPLYKWTLLFGINIFAHIFIDTFNAYGTGWFEPFSHRRVSFHTVFVADPLFTIIPLIAALILLFMKGNKHGKRKFWWQFAVSWGMIYLLFTVLCKISLDENVKATMKDDDITQAEYFTTPSPFNSLLWFVVIKKDSGYLVGYHSVFDDNERIKLNYFPRNDHLLSLAPDQEEVANLKQFSDGYYTVQQWNDTLVFNVLRFGQVVGWHDPKEKFVFHYYLGKPGSNRLVTQRGRFQRLNGETVRSLWRRIKGE